MKVTTKDIAAICKVSRGTVDRVLNNRPGVNPKTRETVMGTARELGYRPHQAARSLVIGRTMCIGVMVFDLNNVFFAQLLDAITTRAREAGYFVYITLTNKLPDQEMDCIDHLANGRVDGMIICPVCQGGEYLSYLKGAGVPIVTVMNALEGSGLPHIGINDYQAMYSVAKYSLNKGYTRFAYFSPPLALDGVTNIYCQKQRCLGFLAALEESGIPACHRIFDNWQLGEILRYCGEEPVSKSVIICSSDVFALEVMRYMKQRGVKIPYDVGVMGFDSINSSMFIEPQLTTVSIPIKSIGEHAVEQLIAMIEDGRRAPEQVDFDCTMIVGQTVI